MTPATNMASVYNSKTGVYTYYRIPFALGRPWTMHTSKVGTPVQDALPRLPLGARKVGAGKHLVGSAALGKFGLGLGALTDSASAWRIIKLGAAAALGAYATVIYYKHR